jgi:CheY-like chemotaxis protein
VDDATTTVVGILGDDPLVSRILGLLLEGAGYETRPLDETAILEDPSVALAGVDLVLFLPSLGDERKGELLGVVKDDPATADLPALSLSTDMKAQLDEQSDSVLPWPWSTEALVQAIEQVVHAPGGDEAPRR